MLNARQQQFKEEFTEYLADAAERYAPDTGWTKGHSRSLLRAILNWLGTPAQPFMLTQNKEALHANHVFANLGGFFLDGDGLSTYKEMQQRWLYERHFRNFFIQPFKSENEPPHPLTGEAPLHLSEGVIEELTSELEERFVAAEVLEIFGSQSTTWRQATILPPPSPIAWWSDGVGQVCPILAVYPETGYVNIAFNRTEEHAAFEATYQISGWIPPEYLQFA